jgi:restriction system protein
MENIKLLINLYKGDTMKSLFTLLFLLFVVYIFYSFFGNLKLTILLGLIFLMIASILFFQEREEKKRQERLKQAGMHEIDLMKGIDFEDYLIILFKGLGYRVKGTPASGDYGADFIIEGPKRIVVQAKRYKKPVGIRAVQEILSALTYYDAVEAWVITNNYYTEPAKKLAQKSGVKLIDRNELTELIIQLKAPS